MSSASYAVGTLRRDEARGARRSPALAVLLALAVLVGLPAPALAATGNPSAGSVRAAAAAPAPAPRRMVSAWLPYWTATSALASIEANADLFTDASPFWYDLTPSGSLVRKSRSISDAVIASTVQALRRHNIPVYPTVGERLAAPEMAVFLADPAKRSAHVSDLVGEAVRHGFDGLDLDYESMNEGGTAEDRRAVREGFVTLARELADALHARGKRLALTVGPRSSDSGGHWVVYDYAGLGAVADRFRIMTYDYGWKGGRPDPVAPYWWVDKVLTYAVSRVPAGKVWLGVPTYGYDWPASGAGSAVTYAKAQSLLATTGAKRQWLETGPNGLPVRAPWFTYVQDGVSHTVHYSDAASTRALVDLAGKHRLGGAAFWSAGAEDPRTWEAVRSYARTIAPTPTVVTVQSTAERLPHGERTSLSASVRDAAGRPGPGRHAVLQSRSGPAAPWTAADSAQTSPTGTVAFALTPKAGAEYRVHVDPTWDALPGESTARSFAVSRRVTATSGRLEGKKGRPVEFTGTVTPATAGLTVEVRRPSPSGRITVARGVTDSGGRYRLRVVAKKAGTVTYRVRVAATGSHVRGYSQPVSLRVR